MIPEHQIFVMIFVTLLWSAKGLIVSGDLPVTVPYVDIDKYIGLWYEQARLPHNYQKNCINSTATYTRQDKGIKVNNSCHNKATNKTTELLGYAYPEDETNSKLHLKFPYIPAGKYWVVRLPADYSYAVVTDPREDGLWILCRQPIMSDQLYNQIYASLKADHYPVEKLQKTPHS